MSLADHDRPLNDRGKRNAPEMGRRIHQKGISPELLLTSSAKRAKSTAKRIAKEIGYPHEKILITSKLFHGGTNSIIEVIKSLDNKLNVVMIFGHNPGFTTCANALAGTSISNIPTCGIVSINLKIQSWDETLPGIGDLQFFDFPKNIQN